MKDDYKFEKIFISVLRCCHKYLKPGNKFIIYCIPLGNDNEINISIHSGLDNDNYDDIDNYHNQSKIVVKNLKNFEEFRNIALSCGSLDVWSDSNSYISYIIYTGIA